jgi:hypothetical protein
MTAKNLVSPVALMLVLGLGVPPHPALADQGRGNGKGRGGEKAERAREKAEDRGDKQGRRDDVVVIDREGHRRIVRDYYTTNALPPGLAKRQSLPPGLQKQLRERGTLPPGLQERLTPVPPALGGRLPAVPAYYTRYFAGRDLLIVDTRTNRVVSIVPDVIP